MNTSSLELSAVVGVAENPMLHVCKNSCSQKFCGKDQAYRTSDVFGFASVYDRGRMVLSFMFGIVIVYCPLHDLAEVAHFQLKHELSIWWDLGMKCTSQYRDV